MDATTGPPPLAFDSRRYEMNIRVDEHPDPVAELRRIFDLILRMGREQR
jgi:uncharacterized Ntn-hydrolase superfamily protein